MCASPPSTSVAGSAGNHRPTGQGEAVEALVQASMAPPTCSDSRTSIDPSRRRGRCSWDRRGVGHAADWPIIRGEPRIARLMDRGIFGRKGPRGRIRGRDFAGTVEVIGPGVTGWQVEQQGAG